MIQGTDMIQANELRIGNFILHELFDAVQVISIYKNDYDISRDGNRKEWFIGIGCKGIHITEEWLTLKFGATPFFVNGILTHFRIGLHFIRFDGHSFYFELGKGMNIELTYIHQLQNLYFALTQTELTLK